MLKNTIVINEHLSGFNPTQFGEQKCEPHWSFGPAVRTHWLLHYVKSGTGEFHINGEVYKVKAGSVFVIPPFIETYYEADGENPWHYIWIGFEANSPLPNEFQSPIINCSKSEEVFEDVLRATSLERGKSSYLSACIWRFVSAVLEGHQTNVSYSRKAIHCMQSEYASGITVADIAERLNLDRSYFSTIFKKEIGISPVNYLIDLRLKKALELMERHGESPTSAANSVGYRDLYHFSKAFKKKYGLSPRNYKSLQ